MTTAKTTIEIVRGSVVEQDVDAIVNAANTAMRGGAGLMESFTGRRGGN